MCVGVELPPPPPVVSLPTVIAENNIRFTVKNYNTNNVSYIQYVIHFELAIFITQFTDKALKDFEISATQIIFIGIWINGFNLFSPIPYPPPDRFA